LTFISYGQDIDLSGEWEYKSSKDGEWKKCELPNNVHDIVAGKKVNLDESDQLNWIQKEKFYFRKVIYIPLEFLDRQSTKLVLHHVDTYCRVLINDDIIDTLENFFHPSNIEIHDNLLPGENEIILEFIPLEWVWEKRLRKFGSDFSDQRKKEEIQMMTRKPRYMSAWNISPEYNSFGVYGKMRLKSHDHIEINHVNFKLLFEDDGRAKILAKLNVNVFESGAFKFESSLFTHEAKILSGKNRDVIWTFFIDDFEYWFPKGLGEQKIYKEDLTVFFHRLEDKDYIEEMMIPFDLAFNKVELIKNPKNEDEFSFEMEGMELEMNATLFRPFNVFPNRFTDQDYQSFFKKVEQENINLVRVWGGGDYGSEKFYDKCDSMGIMVWQDFAFSGYGYHTDSNFVKRVRKEVDYQLKRIVVHPSLLLFSGNDNVSYVCDDVEKALSFGITKKEIKVFQKNESFLFNTLIKNRINKFNSRILYKMNSPKFDWKETQYNFGKMIMVQ
jgi:beta-mannosidase